MRDLDELGSCRGRANVKQLLASVDASLLLIGPSCMSSGSLKDVDSWL
jgi:hypothetical protein